VYAIVGGSPRCYAELNVYPNDTDQGPAFSDGRRFITVGMGGSAHGDLSHAQSSGTWYIRYDLHHSGPFTDDFTYTIEDVAGGRDTATVKVTVGSPPSGVSCG
jgi:hypothetical protein